MSAMRPVAVLMYHAVEPVGAVSDADPHYSVEPAAFAAQLDAFSALGRRVCSVRDLLERAAAGTPGSDAVALTFDDGHASNGAAADALAARGMTADFFVNPAQVGGPHRLSWAALRDMAAAGMSIQSHGHDHVHLDTLGPEGVHDSLAHSKAAIEDALGTAVTLFAPPGGRLHPSLAATAARLGYRALCTSRPGRWTPAEGTPAEVPRLAVLAGTGAETLRRWALADPMTITRARLRAGALDAAKRLLGTGRYERLREAALKGRT